MRFEADILGLPGLLVKARWKLDTSSGSCYLRSLTGGGRIVLFPFLKSMFRASLAAQRPTETLTIA
jgi:hypothetical protein